MKRKTQTKNNIKWLTSRQLFYQTNEKLLRERPSTRNFWQRIAFCSCVNSRLSFTLSVTTFQVLPFFFFFQHKNFRKSVTNSTNFHVSCSFFISCSPIRLVFAFPSPVTLCHTLTCFHSLHLTVFVLSSHIPQQSLGSPPLDASCYHQLKSTHHINSNTARISLNRDKFYLPSSFRSKISLHYDGF